MNELQIFNYGKNEIRTVMIDGEPWFVLRDVCQALDIARGARVAERLDEDEVRQAYITDSLGRQQETTIISESGLYAVILRSDKPEAKPFRKWVTAEVLPAIRKKGGYIAPGAFSKTLEDLAAAVQLLTERLDMLTAQQEKFPFVALLEPGVEDKIANDGPTSNTSSNLQYRIFSEEDRTWSEMEVEKMLACALEYKREDYFSVLCLGRYAGLSVRECFCIDVAAAEIAVEEKALTVRGEDGLIRTVPLTHRLIERLRYHLLTRQGRRLLVASGKATNGAIKEFENFVWVFQHHAQDL